MTYRIKLGQEVRDNITGFQGVATARTLWLHGCERILVYSILVACLPLPTPRQRLALSPGLP